MKEYDSFILSDLYHWESNKGILSIKPNMSEV